MPHNTMTQTAERLSREIRRWDLVALLINVTVGAGVFRLPAEAYAAAGAYSLLAIVICAVVMGLIVLCFAEVASRFTGTGGPYLYARETFGPAVAFMVGWLMWLTRLAGFGTLCNLLVIYLGYFWPAASSGLWRAVVITGIVLSLTIINLVGVRESAVVGNILTAGKLAPLLLFVAVGLFFIDPGRFSSAARPGLGSLASGVFVLVWMFSGFEAVLINSGEIREPRRSIPFALAVSLSTSSLLFILIQAVCIGTLPQLGGSERPLAEASSRFLGGAGPSVISAGALISILGTMNVIMLASSRIPFALAEQGQLPRFLLRIHPRFRTPHVSILISAALVLLLALSGTFIYLLTLSLITRIIVYAVTCAALPVLRRRKAAPAASFKAPAGVLVSIGAVMICVALLFSAQWHEVRDVVIGASAGLVLYLGLRFAQRLGMTR
ncbi:MAG TPA: amino acid permease [Blastocatellia bacterium]|nr:amino acid permease [Blastocatellia bacterium]